MAATNAIDALTSNDEVRLDNDHASNLFLYAGMMKKGGMSVFLDIVCVNVDPAMTWMPFLCICQSLSSGRS
jgi:hypothetical protein